MIKLKIAFGIVIPLLIIIIIAILGANNIGLEIEEKFVPSLGINEISTENYIKKSIDIGDVIITNDYFLGRRIDLPKFLACLHDNEDIEQLITAGYIEYKEGDYSFDSRGQIIIDPYAKKTSVTKSIEVNSNEEKNVNIFLIPDYQFTYKNKTQIQSQYKAYDEILIINIDNLNNKYNSRYDCYSLSDNDILKAEKILINF